MAHLYKRLSIRERYQLEAPYTPAETGVSFHLPDHHGDFFDLVATSLAGPYYFRALPAPFETSPEWEADILCNISGGRCLVNSQAKIVEIPPNHRAWIQYNGLVTHMVEGGADVDIYGRGLAHINIYGIKDIHWSHPQILLDHQHELHHGYASDKLIELVVEGIGRKRAEALARLVAIAKSKGGLGVLSTTRAIGASTFGDTNATSLSGQAIGALATPLGTGSTLTRTQMAIETSEDASTVPTSAVEARESLGRSTTAAHQPNNRIFTLAATEIARQASSSNLMAGKKSPSPPAKSRLPAKQTTPPAAPSTKPQQAPSASIGTAGFESSLPSKLGSTSTSSAAIKGDPALSSGTTSTSAVAPEMQRSAVMEVPKPAGKTSRPLSGAQRRKLKKLAKLAGAVVLQQSASHPPPPSPRASCRTNADGSQGPAKHMPTILEANTLQDLTSTTTKASAVETGRAKGQGAAASKLSLRTKRNTIVDANTRIINFPGSRKRKTTPPQPNQHAENPNKNARPRRDDTSSAKTPQAASNVNKVQASTSSQSTVASSPRTPSRSNNANITTTPSRWLPVEERLARERELSGQSARSYPSPYYYTGYNDRDYSAGNGYERRGSNYYAEDFNNRYALYYSSDYLVAYPQRYYSTLNYDDYHAPSRSSSNQLYSSKSLESVPSRQPLAAPLVPTKGPFLRRNEAEQIGNQVRPLTSSKPHKQRTYALACQGSSSATTTPITKPFSRAVSPPPSSRHSLRATATDFYPLPAKPAPLTSSDPRRRLGEPQPNTTQLKGPLPAKPVQTPFPFPFPTSTPFPITANTAILAANTAELVETGSIDRRTKQVTIKSEEGVIESKLDDDGWQIVGKERKVSADDVVRLARALSKTRQTQTGSWVNDQGKNAPPSSVALSRPQAHQDRPTKVTLSSLSTVPIEDEWNTDMDIDASGERFDHICDLHELIKSHRQNKVDKNKLKTSERRLRSFKYGNRDATKGVGFVL